MILKALQRSFRNMHDQWDMHFAANPGQAMAMLASLKVDVLMTELVFADRSGVSLLRETGEKYPHIVRIILSGYMGRDVILQTVDLAHQFISKPWEEGTIKGVIERAFRIKSLLDEQALKKVLAGIGALPSLPSAYLELVDALESEDTSFEDIGRRIAKDPALMAKILKLVNSSFFGLYQAVSDPVKAVSLLGLDLVRAVVLGSGVFDAFKGCEFKTFSLEQLWDHAAATAGMAKIIAQASRLDRREVDAIFMAALLHDVGKLPIAAHLPESFAEILDHMRARAIPMTDAESIVLGTTHASVGGYLLGLWGLPDFIFEAVAYHHNPGLSPAGPGDAAVITHVADAFTNAGSALAGALDAAPGLDHTFIRQAGLAKQLEQWQKACCRQLEGAAR